MGSNYSSLKNSLSSKNVPRHLKPMKPKKKKSTTTITEEPPLIKINKVIDNQPPKIIVCNEEDDEFAEETVLVGSGPRGAFRWFKGRRYLNYAKQGGLLDNCLLPNDQLELDRMRVLSYIIRWGFKGHVIAPVKEELENGIQVLNVGFGPGMWTGHHIIDMAMDYPNSNFTTVDVLDLLPTDFEETAYNSNSDHSTIDNYKNQNLFTPMHPNLSDKLQSTTTPVIDSSTLDSHSSFSNVLLSKVEETSTSCTFDSATIKEEEEYKTADHLFMGTPTDLNYRKLLPNLDFYQMNIIDAKLPFEDNHFDFVKQQLVTASFTVADWKRVMDELVRVTKPGGYIQLVEIDYYTFNLGPKGRKWETELLDTARLKRQMEPRMARHLPDLLKTAGLIDVSAKLVSIPLGSWGLDLGNLWKHNIEMFVDSTSPLLSKLAGVSDTEYRSRWRDLLQEAYDKRSFSNIHAAWGKKSTIQQNNTIDWSSFLL